MTKESGLEGGNNLENKEEKEKLEARWRQLAQKAAEVHKNISELRDPQKKDKRGEQIIRSVSLRHILGNLSTLISPKLFEAIDSLRQAGDDKNANIAQWIQTMENNIEYIERYLKLLDEFPNFGMAERSDGTGYFALGIRDKDGNEIIDSKILIDEYEARLRAEAAKEVESSS